MWTWELILSIFLIGVSLSMDAFAVSICDGMCYTDLNKRKGGVISAAFGIFQMGMPLIGFFVAFALSQVINTEYIDMFDHWVAIALLAFVGGKMIFDAVREMRHPEEQLSEKRFSLLEVTVQAVATSIDALAVGIGMIAMYSDGVTEVTVWGYTAIIGATTFLISVAGVFLGTRVGKLFQRKTSLARVLGGVILVGIGLKILIEGLL